MAANIYISPNNMTLVELSGGKLIPLPFSTSDPTLQTSIESSQAYTNGDVVKNNSYVPPFPDIYVFTTTDI